MLSKTTELCHIDLNMYIKIIKISVKSALICIIIKIFLTIFKNLSEKYNHLSNNLFY